MKKKKRSKENEENKSMKHGVSQMTANPQPLRTVDFGKKSTYNMQNSEMLQHCCLLELKPDD